MSGGTRNEGPVSVRKHKRFNGKTNEWTGTQSGKQPLEATHSEHPQQATR